MGLQGTAMLGCPRTARLQGSSLGQSFYGWLTEAAPTLLISSARFRGLPPHRPLLVAVAELFVPVLDDADCGGRGFGALDGCDRQKSFTVGGDVVAPSAAASR